MARRKDPSRRTSITITGAREAQRLAALLGAELAKTRRMRHMTLEQLSRRVGLGRTRLGDIERGRGATAPLGTWISLGIAIGRPVAVSFSRDLSPEPRDGGHLAAQELVLRLARAAGRDSSLELTVGSGWQPLSIDVVQRDRRARTLIINEIWNVVGDFGAALRNHDRKMEEAERLATLASGDCEPWRVASCWVLRATAANRALISRYPEVFRSRFPGSSRAWVSCLSDGAAIPPLPGIVWADLASTRLFAMRLSALNLRAIVRP